MSFTLSRQSLELRMRRIEVVANESLTPACRRIRFRGEELAGFESPGADDHVRVFFPPDDERSREYTPVEFDGIDELVLDFVLHGDGEHAGVAAAWAARAEPGDTVLVGGPRGSLVIDGDPDSWLLAGDLTALPAIRRFASLARPGVPVDVIVVADDLADMQEVASPGAVTVRWLRPAPGAPAADAAPLVAALREAPVHPGDGFTFVAAEQSVVRPARAALRERGVDLDRATVKGYWKRGEAEYHAPH